MMKFGLLAFFCIGFSYGQVDMDLTEAVKMFHVKKAHVPSDPKGAGKMLMEFKHRMVLLDQRVKTQMESAPDWKKQNGATDLEFAKHKQQILASSMKESVDIARRFRDPAMARLVAEANRGLKPSAKIILAGGTGPKGGTYRGGFGDVDLQGNANAIDQFKKLFDKASIPEKSAFKPGYISYEDIDITLHKMGRTGVVGSSTLQSQVSIDASTKETYVSSSMKKGQVGGKAVLLQDHMKKVHKGARLTPSKLMNSPDALQSFAKGTAKCIDTAGLNHILMAKILKNAGYNGSVTSFKQKLLLLKSEGYDRAPKELGLDTDGMRVFKKAALSLISAADQKTWSKAQSAMHNERLKIAELRRSKNPVKAAEANRRQLDLEDSTMRLNETFLANKKRFHWMGDRNKIKLLLVSSHTQKMRFISYMSSAPVGRRMGITFLMEQARKDPAAARKIMKELPPHVRARMRSHPDFAAFEAELAKTATSVWRQDVHLPAFAMACKTRIDRINTVINQKIQDCAYTRGFSKGMNYYGKLSEVQSYYQAWQRGGPEELIVDIIRKRIPFMTTVELAMMDNYWMAGWDVICTVLPPVGLLSAAGNIGMGIGKTGVDYLYEYELLDFEEQLYRTAKFELTGVTSLEDAKLGQWKLVSVKPEKRVFTRQKLLDGWLSVPPGASTIITGADPVLAAINEMMKHPDVGKRLLYGKDGYGGYWEQYLDRKKQVFKWWAQKAIANLELRKTTQDAWVRGQLPIMYAQLIKTAKSLSVEKEINAALDAEMGSGLLDPLRQWIKDVTFRNDYIQGTAQSSLREEAAAKAVVQYLETYKKVFDARARAEMHAELNPKTDSSIRILTGPTSLFINLAEDGKAARNWSSLPLLKKTEVKNKMRAIKARYLDQVSLTSKDDKSTIKQLLTHGVWLDAWTHAIRVSQDKKIVSADFGTGRRAYHRTQFDSILKAFDAYYAKLAAVSIRFEVVEEINGVLTEKPVRGAHIRITDATGARLNIPQSGGNLFILRRILPGMYRYTVDAVGYGGPNGGKVVDGFVRLGIDDPKHNERIGMEPIPGSIRMEIVDDLGIGIPQAIGMMEASGRPPRRFDADKHGNVFLENMLSGIYLIETFTLGYRGKTSSKFVLDPARPKKNTPQPFRIELTSFLSTVKVQVRDGRGLPVEDAIIHVGSMEKVSDSTGSAVFEEVRPSRGLVLQAIKSGLLTASKKTDLRPSAEGTIQNHTLVMKGGVTLTVRVHDEETREPLQVALVQVESLQAHGSQETGSSGEAEITGLSPDFMYVRVSKKGYLDKSNVEVDLRSVGSKASEEKEILLQKGMKCTVLIRGENQELLAGAYAQMDEGLQLFAPTGKVVFSPVKNGRHLFKALAKGYTGGLNMYSAKPDTISEDTIIIDLMPGMTILGEVRDERGLLFRESATQLQLMRANSPVARGNGPRFLFANLEPGTYSLVASARGYESQTTPSVTLTLPPEERTLTAKLLTTGLLTVIVKGHEGTQSILPEGVNVELSGPGLHLRKQGVVTRFPNLVPASYMVKATAQGFLSDSKKVMIKAVKNGMLQHVTLHLQKEGAKDEVKDEVKDEKLPADIQVIAHQEFDIDAFIDTVRRFYTELYESEIHPAVEDQKKATAAHLSKLSRQLKAWKQVHGVYVAQVCSQEVQYWFDYIRDAPSHKKEEIEKLLADARDRLKHLNPNHENTVPEEKYIKKMNPLLTRAKALENRALSLPSKDEMVNASSSFYTKRLSNYVFDFQSVLYAAENTKPINTNFPERVAESQHWGEKRFASLCIARRKNLNTAIGTLRGNLMSVQRFHKRITELLLSGETQEIKYELMSIAWAIEDAEDEKRTQKYHEPSIREPQPRTAGNLSIPPGTIMGFSPAASYKIIEQYVRTQADLVVKPRWTFAESDHLDKLKDSSAKEIQKINNLFREIRARSSLEAAMWSIGNLLKNGRANLVYAEWELSRTQHQETRQRIQVRITKTKAILSAAESLKGQFPKKWAFEGVFPTNAFTEILFYPYSPQPSGSANIPYFCSTDIAGDSSGWDNLTCDMCRWSLPSPDRTEAALAAFRHNLALAVKHYALEQKGKVLWKSIEPEFKQLEHDLMYIR